MKNIIVLDIETIKNKIERLEQDIWNIETQIEEYKDKDNDEILIKKYQNSINVLNGLLVAFDE